MPRDYDQGTCDPRYGYRLYVEGKSFLLRHEDLYREKVAYLKNGCTYCDDAEIIIPETILATCESMVGKPLVNGLQIGISNFILT